MNPVVVVHLLAAVAVVVAAVPLVQQRVKMNHWYGVRIPAAFTSEAAWFDLNRYGGRLLLIWGLTIAATAAVGAFLAKRDWVTYDWTSLVIIVGGLVVTIAKIYSRARRQETRG
jgi:uncharacterized membrane protein